MSWHKRTRRIDVIETWKRARAEYAAVLAERDVLKRDVADLRRPEALSANGGRGAASGEGERSSIGPGPRYRCFLLGNSLLDLKYRMMPLD